MEQQNPKMLSPLTLAFIGDAVLELMVRTRLIEQGSMPVGKLHSEAIKYVSAKAQSKLVEVILPLLSEEEEAIYKRGRNANGAKVPKNTDPADYRRASGLEALFGYLYLAYPDHERVAELFHILWDWAQVHMQ